jgi:uncharacterized membrane protein (UPF0127 family)
VTARYRARLAGTGRTVLDFVRPAHTHWTRFRGLIGRGPVPPGHGLWIRPCRQVHMFWMRHPIDVVFLDDDHRVLHVTTGLRPWRISPKVAGATSVVEIAPATAPALGLVPGVRLEIAPV